MSVLNKFLGSPKEIEINGEKIIIHPLKVKDLSKFSNTKATDEEKSNLAKEMITLSIPETTMEEVDQLPVEAFTKIMEEINKLNGFVDEDIDKIKLERRLRQQGASNAK